MAVQDATRAIELEPGHHFGYTHLAVAYTQLPTPDWENALTDMNQHIVLFPGHDPEAYKMRAWIHDNLGNHEEAERNRQLAAETRHGGTGNQTVHNAESQTRRP